MTFLRVLVQVILSLILTSEIDNKSDDFPITCSTSYIILSVILTSEIDIQNHDIPVL